MYRLGKFQAIGVLLGARNNRFGNHWHVEADWIWGLQWGIKDKSEFHWHDGYVQTLQFQYFTSDGSTPLIQMHIWFWDSSFQTWGSFVITVPVSLTSIKQTSKFKSQKSNHTVHFFCDHLPHSASGPTGVTTLMIPELIVLCPLYYWLIIQLLPVAGKCKFLLLGTCVRHAAQSFGMRPPA